ncbi:Actin-binding LIM protein 1 [Trichinella pseudospiralis]|uniref:Actin-binding LIM protein 1 n=1 Tax=Trichinella pseudospiralis TaxID=6337 RepID=A0A0V1KEA2_TRIPS|nr:Actin-binding LIM protein 1 [Trichinella pseudospiralis]KRZ45540.1 Actin-binding LIM protein 1 [Trichinella pseudospiralis]
MSRHQDESLPKTMALKKSPKLKSSKVRCEACKKKCTGDIFKSDDKYFHIKCFVCKVCKQPLKQAGFIMEGGDYYCLTDYYAKFGVRCAICDKFIEDEVTNFSGKTYHSTCFKCDRCKSVIPAGSVTCKGEQKLCTTCASSLKSPKKAAPLNDTLASQDCHDLMDSMCSPGVCAACDQVISSGQVLLALDTQWHTWCFKCAACHCVLHGEYMEKDGLAYCIRDYDVRFGVKCHECNKYITGKVLQAGNFHFHSNCARCSRCDMPFLDGQEMYMHGNEIWHPACNELSSSDNTRSVTAHVHRSSPQMPKYSVDFGRHLLYMYLLPEPNMGYLKQPISPYPPRAPQFHTPQGSFVLLFLQVGKLKSADLEYPCSRQACRSLVTEALEDTSPRPHSPAMNNEEPIELSHYPGAHVPAPNEVAPIERDDFPAPPYPYAVDEFKRRLSSTEGLDEDETDGQDMSKILKAEQQLNRFKDESSMARAFVHEFENQLKKSKVPLHIDPRSASRTPDAKKIPHLRCRYESPINASPSRYVNRPRPWEFWDKNKAATTVIPYAQVPKAGYGLSPKAATLPHSNMSALYDLHFKNSTINSELSNHSYVASTSMSSTERYQPSYGSGVLRSSLPDMSKPPKIYRYSELMTTNKKLPEDVDRCHLERHLSRDEFEGLFGMAPIEFYKLPEWKRINLKRRAKLF